jgi:poly(A) polymerase
LFISHAIRYDLVGPKPIDHEKTAELKQSLEPYGVFESEIEMHHRMEVLGKLNSLVRKWIRDLSMQRNMPPSVADTVGGNVYTFGSYRLGVRLYIVNSTSYLFIVKLFYF